MGLRWGPTKAVSHSVNADGVGILLGGGMDTSTLDVITKLVWTFCTEKWWIAKNLVYNTSSLYSPSPICLLHFPSFPFALLHFPSPPLLHFASFDPSTPLLLFTPLCSPSFTSPSTSLCSLCPLAPWNTIKSYTPWKASRDEGRKGGKGNKEGKGGKGSKGDKEVKGTKEANGQREKREQRDK